jgi:hypothetical protein
VFLTTQLCSPPSNHIRYGRRRRQNNLEDEHDKNITKDAGRGRLCFAPGDINGGGASAGHCARLDGTIAAPSIVVGRDGVNPPM